MASGSMLPNPLGYGLGPMATRSFVLFALFYYLSSRSAGALPVDPCLLLPALEFLCVPLTPIDIAGSIRCIRSD
jgi:hypothetical protein